MAVHRCRRVYTVGDPDRRLVPFGKTPWRPAGVSTIL